MFVCAGVVARHPGYVPYLRAALTPEVVADYFSHLIDDNTPVERYNVILASSPGPLSLDLPAFSKKC